MRARGVKGEEVVRFVAGYIDAHGYSPSIRDICDGVGLNSKSTVWYYLERLRDEGRVTWLDKQPRTLRLVPISNVESAKTSEHTLYASTTNPERQRPGSASTLPAVAAPETSRSDK